MMGFLEVLRVKLLIYALSQIKVQISRLFCQKMQTYNVKWPVRDLQGHGLPLIS